MPSGSEFSCRTKRLFGKVECYIMAGIVTGASQILLNKKFACIEEKCLCKGDPYCEFKLKETGNS